VFRETARVLVPGGRLAIADIIATRRLPESVTSNAALWSACIGGAAPEVDYRAALDDAGLALRTIREVSQYRFLTDQARNASREYGVRAVTLRADLR
jgi:arsenite methyltransferase